MQPNILFLQADQLSASALSFYGNQVTRTPNLDRLAEQGLVFDNAYCNNPLCVPSRASMLTGLLGSTIDIFDNASELRASIPTFVHYLRSAGYQTCLSGKMHFIGPDQLHGYEERLTTDIYPSDFVWTERWDEIGPKHALGKKTFRHVGPCEQCRQLAYDDEVAFKAERKLYDMAMGDDERPFFLTVSFSNPHEPYLARREFWDLYSPEEIDLPRVRSVPEAKQDYHSRNFERIWAFKKLGLTDQELIDIRRAYYANVSYVDDKIGRLLKVLETTGMDENTWIIFTSDHGDMLGERGLWWKTHFYEDSSRVPLVVLPPDRTQPGHIEKNVSLIDLFPTILDVAGIDPGAEVLSLLEGNSLFQLLEGQTEYWSDTVYCESFYGGTPAPMFMVRKGRFKYTSCPINPSQLYDLENDPLELENLAGDPEFESVEKEFETLVHERWDAGQLHQTVVASQRARGFIAQSLSRGQRTLWNFEPAPDQSLGFRQELDRYYEWFGTTA
jgi:choline-sulfatase